MKKALQAILMSNSDEQWADILSGIKEITIREGSRDYSEGFCILANIETNRTVGVDITSVRHCQLKEVTHLECLEDNFRSHEDMYAGMKAYYPEITPESEITVIKWKNVRGLLVDDYNSKI